jgi:hypothetical protein
MFVRAYYLGGLPQRNDQPSIPELFILACPEDEGGVEVLLSRFLLYSCQYFYTQVRKRFRTEFV